MKLSSIVLATGLALGSAGAMAAGGPLDLSSGSTGFSSTPVAGGFSDSYTFTLGTASFLSSTITSVVSGTQDVDFMGIFLTGPSGVFNFTKVLDDPYETWAIGTGLLSAGSYTLTLLGTNTASVASYAGNVAVTAVPEPETAALLLAGMAVTGFLVRRRSSV